jgi:hypothetical protein
MSFFRNLFGKKSAEKEQIPTFLYEKDNMGTRHDTLSIADSYWMARMTSPRKDPFVCYVFDDEEDARAALLELPCIHVALDTDKLICTEVLIFGYYQSENGKYEAILCGDDLTHERWEQAKASFIKHGGHPFRQGELEPVKFAGPAQGETGSRSGKVVFIREDRQQRAGATLIYRIHKGPDAATAKAFLEKNPVDQKLYYIIVETPDGNYCRDIQGIYKE